VTGLDAMILPQTGWRLAKSPITRNEEILETEEDVDFVSDNIKVGQAKKWQAGTGSVDFLNSTARFYNKSKRRNSLPNGACPGPWMSSSHYEAHYAIRCWHIDIIIRSDRSARSNRPDVAYYYPRALELALYRSLGQYRMIPRCSIHFVVLYFNQAY
jgi:hypothetical protein